MVRIEEETARLEARLAELAREYANLVAAARAALLAQNEGEADPLWYVRDQLPPAPVGHPLHPAPDPDPYPGTDPDPDPRSAPDSVADWDGGEYR